jgi:hypothetical protein
MFVSFSKESICLIRSISILEELDTYSINQIYMLGPIWAGKWMFSILIYYYLVLWHDQNLF